MKLTGKRFKPADVFQQMIGGFLLAGPFVVKGSVWEMAKNMQDLQAGILVLATLAIGYGALYRADKDREPVKEVKVLGVPVRFISMLAVSYGAVAVLMVLLSASVTNYATIVETLRVVSVAGVFSVIGAATADSVF